MRDVIPPQMPLGSFNDPSHIKVTRPTSGRGVGTARRAVEGQFPNVRRRPKTGRLSDQFFVASSCGVCGKQICRREKRCERDFGRWLPRGRRWRRLARYSDLDLSH